MTSPAMPLRFGDFELQPVERRLLRGGQPVPLGALAFDVHCVPAQAGGRLVTKNQMHKRGPRHDPVDDRIVHLARERIDAALPVDRSQALQSEGAGGHSAELDALLRRIARRD